MNRATPSVVAFFVLVTAASFAEMPEYWPHFPHPKTLYVTEDVDGFPSAGPGDPAGLFSGLTFTLQSLAGLAAAGVKDGVCDSMLWIDMPKNASYNLWREEVLKYTGAVRVPVTDPYELIKKFHDKGLVKGYILYRNDRSKRDLYDAPPSDGAGYNNSANVATSLANSMKAVIVEEASEGPIKALGLPMLLDVRDKDEAWLFEHHAPKLARNLVHVIDPRAPHMRDYAVATNSICIFGISPTTDKVLAWVQPNAPAMGWGGGDEYKFTSQLSRFGHFTTASNWIFNLCAISSVQAEHDIAWQDLRVNDQATVDPLLLDWPKDAHFTAFVMSDGNNFMWFLGDFFAESYWQAPSRGAFPFGWTAPVCDMVQAGTPALAHLRRTASPHDYIMMHDAGYFYYDEYAVELDNRRDVLVAKIRQDAERMAKLGIRVLSPLLMDWDSEAAMEAYEICAREIPGLVAIMPIQYAPYNAGLGKVLWVKNAEGVPIPVISARYGLWGRLTQLENNGPPALLAHKINAGARKGYPVDETFFDWTIVHAWSWFKKADGGPDFLGEEMDQAQGPSTPGARRGFEPVGWCVERLAPSVRVVTPEELAWRLRVHLKPKETLDALAASLDQNPGQPTTVRDMLGAYRAWLAIADLTVPESAREAFERLQQIRLGKAPLPATTR